MAATSFDIPKVTRTLKTKQVFTHEQVDILMEAIVSAFMTANLSTKSDIECLKNETKAATLSTKSDIEHLRKETKRDIEFLRAETKNDIESLKAETKSEIESLKAETKSEIESLKNDIKQIRSEMVTKSELQEVKHDIEKFKIQTDNNFEKYKNHFDTALHREISQLSEKVDAKITNMYRLMIASTASLGALITILKFFVP